MAYSEQEARELVIKAGRRLKQEGLIARTWGNISARISDSHFVITPSGLDYDTMEAEDLVTVCISDGSYEGKKKPSSEKGIHADAYRLRPEACFVIHTHQDKASVFGVLGEPLRTDGEYKTLGSLVPCAKYGLPSTKKLQQAVAAEIMREPEARAVLLKNHGTLCMGKDYAEAFLVSKELERACGGRISQMFREQEAGGTDPCSGSQKDETVKLGKSQRKGNRFCHLLNGERRVYDLRTCLRELPLAAAIHAAVYRNSDVSYIAQESGSSVVEFCGRGETLFPYLDDLAQIAGVNVPFSIASPEAAAKAIKGRNAVFIRGGGALCTGKTADDVAAVRMILKKGCEAGLLAGIRQCNPLGPADARLQRMIYQKKYSKKKGSV